MNRQIERRRSDRSAEEALSPEFLKVLEVCGGDIRKSDRAAPAGQHGNDATHEPTARSVKPVGPGPGSRG